MSAFPSSPCCSLGTSLPTFANQTRPWTRRAILWGALAAAVCFPAAVRAEANRTFAAPKHLAAAQRLVAHLSLENTGYEHGHGSVVWTGTCAAHTDCSGFINHLLAHSYGLSENDFKTWLGSSRPNAARYHDAMERGQGFTCIQRVGDLRPGDLLAVKYLKRTDNSGHMMLVVETPHRATDRKPLVNGTEQWEVTVIDSSKSGHGKTDTRHALGEGGKDHPGLGRGVLRIYARPSGEISGFSWSTLGVSDFIGPGEEHLLGGRWSGPGK